MADVIGLGGLVDTVGAGEGRDTCQTCVEELSVLVDPKLLGFFGGIVV